MLCLWDIYVLINVDGKCNIYKLAHNLNVTYSHLFGTIKKLSQHKMVEIEKIGRTNHITLTKLGKEVSEVGNKLNELIGYGKQRKC